MRILLNKIKLFSGMKNASHNQINNGISSRKPASNNASVIAPVNSTNFAKNTGLNHQTNSSKLITNRALEDQNIIPSNRQQQNFSTKQFSNSISIPHARALYDFTSKENGYYNTS